MREVGDPAAPMQAGAARSGRAVVLLVDDQPMVGDAIRSMLRDQPDIEYEYCSQSSLAVETAERLKPTVILQDLAMPDVDGLTLVRRYRASAVLRDTPVIVLSSEEDPAIRGDAFQGGANDYLVKVPDRIELVARIRLHSKAFVTQIQRDEAYRHLTESQRQLVASNSQLEERVRELQAVRDELSRLVSTDPMTGLYSRGAMVRARRHGVLPARALQAAADAPDGRPGLFQADQRHLRA